MAAKEDYGDSERVFVGNRLGQSTSQNGERNIHNSRAVPKSNGPLPPVWQSDKPERKGTDVPA